MLVVGQTDRMSRRDEKGKDWGNGGSVLPRTQRKEFPLNTQLECRQKEVVCGQAGRFLRVF